MRRPMLLSLVLVGAVAGCVQVPSGPSVMVLPGAGRSFDQFNYDDAVCRDWALRQTGVRPSRAANDTAVATAAAGTVLGAATGAAIGAASGNPATGAAVGAGAGLLGGSLVGAGSANASYYETQHRYDVAYMQCMYAKGNQIPVPRGSHPPRSMVAPPSGGYDVPPPPRGGPPPPPYDY